MTHPTLDHEERLRSALRAAADSVEPAADGLGRIRARLTPPRPVIAAWMVSWTEPAMLRLRLVVPWLRLRLDLAHGRIGPVAGRAHPVLGRITAAFTGIMPTRGEPRTRTAWLRPARRDGGLRRDYRLRRVRDQPAAADGDDFRQHRGDRPQRGAPQLRRRCRAERGRHRAPVEEPLVEEHRLAARPAKLAVQYGPASTGAAPGKPGAILDLPAVAAALGEPEPDTDTADLAVAVAVEPTPTPTPTPTSVSPSPTSPPTSPPVSPSPGASDIPTPSGAPAASVNTVAYVVGPVSGSAASSSPATNKSACAPTGQ